MYVQALLLKKSKKRLYLTSGKKFPIFNIGSGESVTIKKLSQAVDIDDDSSVYDDGSEEDSGEGSEEESDGEPGGSDEVSSTDSDNEGE